jgi:phosphoglycolate phosphatase-like HAD superfamily hydrolase
MKSDIKIIFWDFDGVLINSNPIRDLGFEDCLSNFPKYQVEQLLSFHKSNGGLSRYVKFRYFFEKIRNEIVSEEIILDYANSFSLLMREKLVDKKLLIDTNIEFIKNNYKKYQFHITSGSDQNELRYLCNELDISKYFISINGSPTPKNDLIKQLLIFYNYDRLNCLLIGDSYNDYQASRLNGIYFKSYNGSKELDSLSNCDFI